MSLLRGIISRNMIMTKTLHNVGSASSCNSSFNMRFKEFGPMLTTSTGSVHPNYKCFLSRYLPSCKWIVYTCSEIVCRTKCHQSSLVQQITTELFGSRCCVNKNYDQETLKGGAITLYLRLFHHLPNQVYVNLICNHT